MFPDWHAYLAFAVWNIVVLTLFLTGGFELDEKFDPATDLGEQPINAEGWNW